MVSLVSNAGLCFNAVASVAASIVELGASVATASLPPVVAVTLGRLRRGGVG